MSRQFLILLCIGLFSQAFAATSTGFFDDPKHPGKCTISKDFILAYGESAKHPTLVCGSVDCHEGGVANFFTCGVELIPSNCKFGDYKNPEANYPKCCARHILCDE